MGKYVKIVVVAIISCFGLLANAHATSSKPEGAVKTIRLNTPGTLLSVITPNELEQIESLTITGYMNKADANVLTELGTNIIYLNLNDCHIINSEEAYQGQGCVIPYGFMRDRVKLKTVIFPENLRSIEDFAFQNCTSLEEIILSQSLKYMNNGLWAGEDGTPFKGCTSLKKIIFNGTILKNKLILPEDIASSLKEIRFAGTTDGSAVGYYHGIYGTVRNAKVYIPASIKSDFGGTFENCEIFFESPKAPESIYYLKLQNCTVHIPKGSITSYYSKFGNLNFIESDYPQQTTASDVKNKQVPEGYILTHDSNGKERWVKPDIYKGTIGKYKITMQLNDITGSPSGNFIVSGFYWYGNGSNRKMTLKGELSYDDTMQRTYRFVEYDPKGNKCGSFILREGYIPATQTNTLQGSMTNKAGTTYKVYLKKTE